jgi:signal transduction histidine kinase
MAHQIYVDRELRVLDSCGTLLTSLGLTNEIKEGEDCSEALGKFWRIGFNKLCCEAITAGKSSHKETSCQQHGHQLCWLDVAIEPFVKSERIVGAVLTIEDITVQKRLKRRETLKEKMSNLSLLAANIANKLNNPLAAILNRIGFLLMEDVKKIDGVRLRSELQSIQEQIYAMSIITNALEAFSRDSTTQFKILNVRGVLEKSIELSRLLHLHDKKVAYKVKFAPSLPSIIGNEITLEQCFINIIRNSLEAMPGGGTLTINASMDKASPEHIRIVIRDTGLGIPKKNAELVYDPFFSDKGGDHAGLGLSISYGIIANHYGSIEVDSKENKGTTVTIVLPAAKK